MTPTRWTGPGRAAARTPRHAAGLPAGPCGAVTGREPDAALDAALEPAGAHTANPADPERAERADGRAAPDGAGAHPGAVPDAAPGRLVPLHVAGPEGDWEPVREQAGRWGRAVVHTTWGEWMGAALLDPGLRALLGRDWARYRQTDAPAGRLRFAASRVVLRCAAAAVLEVPAGELDVAYRPGGQPYLRGLGQIGVSLTHTDDLIVVGVCRGGAIGVDAEPVGRRTSFELLRDHLCTPREAAELALLPDAERGVRLLRLWTLKEAYTKALGHGMRRRFSAVGFCRDAAGRVVPDEDPPAAAQWELATHLVRGRYLVSVAHRGPGALQSGSGADQRRLEETHRQPVPSLRWPQPDVFGAYGDGRGAS
ncbi:4'-phosphopantetheinyl transferase superfamily protein [Streptomyces sp. NBC_01007]|nr:4'-phosphopantetheinyl transferase superfamily protein [Streptomyces sp. NBC_01007]WRZ95681.1 4'-phosphopantetheinyl transferase superfamily protein [Streptomyces sp. NBC_01007]